MSSKHEEMQCSQGDKITRLDQEMAKLNKAMFFGNGQPSVLSQLAVMRQTIQALSWLVGITCCAVVGQIVAKLFDK
jgi:hypothetical protein